MTLFFIFPSLLTHTQTRSSRLDGKVVKIVDGDTYDLLTQDHQLYRIRMNGIDAPEKKQALPEARQRRPATPGLLLRTLWGD